ncbi:hypothetical protein E3983_06955 [Legionella israelensis]|uniref:LPS-assembly lipoprotein LptE n=1 Tax=Legionella israelensis TaxID=454 RepID=A0A0W0VKY9_9GAMM|nr:LPS assembly lipoprotein LptE [Legionella israelensis]KTD20763.1 rare lipoprotein B [Legionella israelensis]QBR84117.1 hypothetical protein E3983_06955 [Legionella israelensis]QBS11005.1 hypothetical protein E4T55_14825 [Legionella israelensis]SCY06674.1 LPS-assembly lipoprotein [Legionella israelensis DSM 19235]STX57999.1 Rare lipoprotein B [Legionella israelensis]
MRKILIFFASILLVACGFHLRGSVDLPKWLDNVFIINQGGDRELTHTLEKYFDAYKITISPSAEQATYWLVIKGAGHEQQITSIGSGSNPRQYELIYFVDFQLQTSKGKPIKPLSHFTVTRQLTVNNDRILGSDEEANLLISEMRRDAAIQILNRLSSIK